MSNTIQKLDKNLANQIAAWEVVERPYSVVKELVENSIDAGASFVLVEIENWWIDKIIVSDNWVWIRKENLALALEKYTTSKIQTLDDLYSVMTFGFRWEALASISSVSKFNITSKYKWADFAYSIEFIDEEIIKRWKQPLDTWTRIEVDDLFYNTPARKHYLKKPRTESWHIADFLSQMALSYPQVWIDFVSDWRKVFSYKIWEDLSSRIYQIYGKSFLESMLEIDVNIWAIHIHWYISDPKVSFWSNKKQNLFVNRRIVKSPIIFKSISNAYNRFIPHGQHSAYILNLELDPRQVDVNVHPRKQEVRFANESHIFRWIYGSVESKLQQVSLISQPDEWVDFFEKREGTKMVPDFQKKWEYYTGSGTKFQSYSPYKDTSPNPKQWVIKDAINFSSQVMSSHNSLNEEGSSEQTSQGDLTLTPLWKIIWQMHNSYIVVETGEWMKILDQHALAERVIYEKLTSASYTPNVQWLLIGVSLQLTERELIIVKKHRGVFEWMWFDIEFLSWTIVMINGIPDFIQKENIQTIVTGVIEDIGDFWEKKSLTLDEVRNKIHAYTSCRSAIKFGHKLSLFEMNRLLCDWALEYSATCPHGRPVIYEIDLHTLQWKYER